VQPTNPDLHDATWMNTAFLGLGCMQYGLRAFEQPPGSQTALSLMRSATLAHNIQVPAL